MTPRTAAVCRTPRMPRPARPAAGLSHVASQPGRPAQDRWLTCLPQVCQGRLRRIERMQLTRGDAPPQHCHRLAPYKPTPEVPGRSIPPIRSDLVGEADTLLAATQLARPILAYPPPKSKHLVGPERSPRRIHTSCTAGGGLAPVDSHTQRTTPAPGDGRGTVGPTPWGNHLNHAKRPEFPATEQTTRVPGCIPSPKPRRSML